MHGWKKRVNRLLTKSFDVFATRDGQERAVVVDSDNKAFMIDFTMMKEISEDPQDTESVPMMVIRRDKIKSN